MNKAWSVEFARIIVVALAVLLIGTMTGHWVLACIIPFSLYVAWTLYQIYRLEQWIRLGAKNAFAPDAGGIWELIVQRIHRAQQKNRQRKKNLAELAKRFEATIAALPDAAIVLNEQLEIEWSNRAALELFSIDFRRDRGVRLDNLVRIQALTDLLISPNLHEPQHIELPSPVEPKRMLHITVTQYGNAQKLVTARDISQRVAVQKMRKAFIANASHELRTPLTVIAGYLEMLLGDSELPAQIIRPIKNAQEQANRMQKILDDLLVLSRLEEKTYRDSDGERINVAELVEKLASDFRKTRAKGTHRIITHLDERLNLRGEENEIYSLCQNLLSNAVKYSPEGSAIKIRWYRHPTGDAVLEVKDNGEGIAKEHLSRLTERFYRVNVNRSRQVGGTGLGLSIVKHILENHGGYLHIDSVLGQGSTFAAHFPASRVCD